ncbi:MAG: nucleotidyltransferase domain-containing protein [Phycisphaerales bacterium]|nr:nucleotidyltransferase domain-containing protein [Phycisphaerales bacterium]
MVRPGESTLAPLARELNERLRAIYADQLSGVYLFGSRVRGEAGAESDMDVLIVLKGFERYGAEVDRTSELVSRLSLGNGVSISRVFMTERDWREADSPFLRSVRSEAVPA